MFIYDGHPWSFLGDVAFIREDQLDKSSLSRISSFVGTEKGFFAKYTVAYLPYLRNGDVIIRIVRLEGEEEILTYLSEIGGYILMSALKFCSGRVWKMMLKSGQKRPGLFHGDLESRLEKSLL